MFLNFVLNPVELQLAVSKNMMGWLVGYLILSVHNVKEQKGHDDQFPAESQPEGGHTSDGGV